MALYYAILLIVTLFFALIRFVSGPVIIIGNFIAITFLVYCNTELLKCYFYSYFGPFSFKSYVRQMGERKGGGGR